MWILIPSLILVIPGYAQADNPLAEARNLVTQGHRQEAILLLNRRLEEEPEDFDARVLIGLIYSWDQLWDEGRRAFSIVLEKDPDYRDAVLGLINLEIWSGHPGRAKELAEKAVAARPQDSGYKVALAKADAALAPPQVVAPGSKRTASAASDELKWEVGVAQSNIFYSDKRSSWHETAVDLSRNFTAGWVTATFSHASWFGAGSNLIDLQSYPRIRPGMYGFVDVALSPDATLYAHRRLGAEIFKSLPHGFEASRRIRYMRFADNTLLITSSAGKYLGNYWFLARTFIEPSSTYATSAFPAFRAALLRRCGSLV